jgi:hypothetical protein
MIPLTILAIAIITVYLAKRTLAPFASNSTVRRAIKYHYIKKYSYQQIVNKVNIEYINTP